MFVVLNICSSGDYLFCFLIVYGGMFNLFGVSLCKFGIDVMFFNLNLMVDEIMVFVNDKMKFIYVELLGNLVMNVLNFKEFLVVVKELEVFFIVDNILVIFYLC